MIPETMMLDSYESICDLARAQGERLDSTRFLLGDLANMVQTKYGDKTMDDFCRDIDEHKKTIYQYSSVARFYPPDIRQRIADDMPTIRYSKMRDAMRLGDIDAAMEWLETVAEQGYTCDEASRKLTESLGRETRESAEGEVYGYGEFGTYSSISIKVNKDDMEWLARGGMKVIIRKK